MRMAFNILIIFASLFVFASVAFAQLQPHTIPEDAYVPVKGWLWNQHFGWTLLNCDGTDNHRAHCHSSQDYPNVRFNKRNNVFEGHAWSEILGYINFGGVRLNVNGTLSGFATIESAAGERIVFNNLGGVQSEPRVVGAETKRVFVGWGWSNQFGRFRFCDESPPSDKLALKCNTANPAATAAELVTVAVASSSGGSTIECADIVVTNLCVVDGGSGTDDDGTGEGSDPKCSVCFANNGDKEDCPLGTEPPPCSDDVDIPNNDISNPPTVFKITSFSYEPLRSVKRNEDVTFRWNYKETKGSGVTINTVDCKVVNESNAEEVFCTARGSTKSCKKKFSQETNVKLICTRNITLNGEENEVKADSTEHLTDGGIRTIIISDTVQKRN